MSKKATQLNKNLAILKRLDALPKPKPGWFDPEEFAQIRPEAENRLKEILGEWDTQSEEPSPYLVESLAISQHDIKKGKVSPGFSNADDAIAWLHEKKPKSVTTGT